jgi:hypothetical protein
MTGSRRDRMWTDEALTNTAEREAKRLGKQFGLDVTDQKELYRTIMQIAIDYADRKLLVK